MENGEGVNVVKPKMAACSPKGGETEALNIGELFFPALRSAKYDKKAGQAA